MEINRKRLMYAILREVNQNSDVDYIPDTFGVESNIFTEVLLILKEEDLMTGIMILEADNETDAFVVGKPRIKLLGIEFLEENSPLAKTYKGLKEIRDWIPF